MSSPLSQDLAAKIIEVLVQRGHVLLSKGGRPALVREIADRTNDTLATIVGRMPPPGVVDNEVTSTFGDEALDDTVEEMVEDVTASLMDSDHVEDVFSEDAVIRRDVFRVVKDALLSSDRVWSEAEEGDVEVNLESLGYIASKAAQRADVEMVEGALSRAAKASQAKLVRYSPETRSATFRAALASPDARLELEEAVADELGSLVDEGKVALPTIERRVPIGRATLPAERTAARSRIDVASTKTLLRSGCTATWEFAGQDAIAVSLVPMSEQDGRAVDAHVEAFAREVKMIFAAPVEPPSAGLDAWQRLARSLEAGPVKAPAEERAPASSKAGRALSREAAPASKRTAEPPASKRPVEAPPSSRKAAPKPAPEAVPPSRKAAPKPAPEAAPSSRKVTKPAAKVAPASRKATKPAVEAAPAEKKQPAKKTKAAREAKPTAKKATAKKPSEKKAKPAAPKKVKPAAPKKPAAKPTRPARKPATVKKAAKPAPRSARPAAKAAPRSVRPAAKAAPRSVRPAAKAAPRSVRPAAKKTTKKPARR